MSPVGFRLQQILLHVPKHSFTTTALKQSPERRLTHMEILHFFVFPVLEREAAKRQIGKLYWFYECAHAPEDFFFYCTCVLVCGVVVFL